ncbi:hypothetical protein K469DRAFT_802471 [Zopfia rhizophila CBS 207.26]|uniref:Heterokaryon incompatibility domain-containing protein n=1 Tax=Zopfia rhizophila CBS 207.26 TaxID=1314779 RepID=A0A6A6D7V9_9PEZI|nr:hypothetical protein K469DRAFT_802471 [Zopfia rhizophila CBS 207.26]
MLGNDGVTSAICPCTRKFQQSRSRGFAEEDLIVSLAGVDTVCINQEKDVEKSHQLAKMLDIYCNAWNVCIWIGESDDVKDDGHHAMDFIPSIVNLKLLNRMVAGEGPDEKMAISWVAFANLLRRPWFRRLGDPGSCVIT